MTPATQNPPLVDTLNRPIQDLRISVTDRCNFRCTYCMPKSVFDARYPFLKREALLTFEEIVRLARLFTAQGVTKIRLTGGEPLLRKHIERLIEQLVRHTSAELTLTTNGALLANKASALRQAGLHRLSVSLDALDAALFRAMCDAQYNVEDVLHGIDAAERAGFDSIKINMVVQRGKNDCEILPMVRRFHGTPHVVRFIEYMDVGSTNGWKMDEVLPTREVLERIAQEFPLSAAQPQYRGEVAERWLHADGMGEIGFISSVTQPFCRDCTRLRLSPDGQLFTCLFASQGHDLRILLRNRADDVALSERIRQIWQRRADRYSELRTGGMPISHKIEMSYIGG